jgi:DnaK suppressor protein
MDKKTLGELRTTLVADRDRLADDLADLERAGHESLSDMSGENNYRDHMADQGTATFSKELDMSLGENVRELLTQVDGAIARIDAGVYGVCTKCSKKIDPSRLKAMPAADMCIQCKEADEKL